MAYLELLLKRGKSKSSVKQILAGIRMLYDWLIVGQVLEINPAQAVRGPKLVVKKGKTPVLDDEQVLRVLPRLVRKCTLRGGYWMSDVLQHTLVAGRM